MIIDPVYNSDTGINNSVCVTKDSNSIWLTNVKLKVAEPLSYWTYIRIDANGTEDWDESTNDILFSGTTSQQASLKIMGNIINSVKKYPGHFQIQWKYRVPSGSNNWIGSNTTSHTVYVTYGIPSPTGYNVTEKRVNWCCEKANGAVDPKGVADGIHLGLNANPPNDGSGDIQSDDWLLLSGTPYKGECDEQARFMVRAIELIGSSGSSYLTYASTDSNVRDQQSKMQDGKKWWLKFDFDNDGTVDNNFEGSVSSGNHYYAVWPSLNAGSECHLLRQIGPDNLGASQRWVRTYDDTFWGYTVEQLPGNELYPNCN
jgi:hypothetical protein